MSSSSNDENVPVVADGENDEYSTAQDKGPSQSTQGQTANPNSNVGGTAKDGGLSTADTVADGGEDDPEGDGEYKPS